MTSTVVERVPSTTADVLREVALLAARAAERVDAADYAVAMDLASRVSGWIDVALVDLRAATGVTDVRQ